MARAVVGRAALGGCPPTMFGRPWLRLSRGLSICCGVPQCPPCGGQPEDRVAGGGRTRRRGPSHRVRGAYGRQRGSGDPTGGGRLRGRLRFWVWVPGSGEMVGPAGASRLSLARACPAHMHRGRLRVAGGQAPAAAARLPCSPASLLRGTRPPPGTLTVSVPDGPWHGGRWDGALGAGRLLRSYNHRGAAWGEWLPPQTAVIVRWGLGVAAHLGRH